MTHGSGAHNSENLMDGNIWLLLTMADGNIAEQHQTTPLDNSCEGSSSHVHLYLPPTFKPIDWALTGEGESGDWQTKNLNVGLVLNSAEKQNQDQDWTFHFHLTFQLKWYKQPVCMIELENSLKEKEHYAVATQLE